MMVIRFSCVWTKARGRPRTPTGQPNHTTVPQDRRFKQLAIPDRFATTCQICDQKFREV